MHEDDLERLLDELERLEAFHKVQHTLRDIDIRGSSWRAIRHRVLASDHPRIASTLAILCADLKIFGRKSLYVFRFPKHVHRQLLALGPKREHAQTTKDLVFSSEDSTRPSVRSIRNTERYKQIIFCSTRQITKTRVLDENSIPDSTRHEFPHAHEIRVTSRIPEPALDAVFISKELSYGIFAVHKSSHRHVHPRDDIVVSHMLSELETQLKSTFFGQRLNLWPALRSIYDDNSEGRIVRIEFLCPSSAKRRESLLCAEGTDLRTEKYHRAGREAIGEKIDIFGITVQWDLDDTGRSIHDARLSFMGDLRSLERRELYKLQMSSLCGEAEHTFIMRRVLSHVPEATEP